MLSTVTLLAVSSSSPGLCTELGTTITAFGSHPRERSQQRKRDKVVHLWTEAIAPVRNQNMRRKALWADGWSTSAWAKARLSVFTQSRLQSCVRCGTRDWSQDTVQGNGSRHVHSARTTSEAISVLKNNLQRGIAPDSDTYVQVLQLCLKQKDLVAVKQVHDFISKSRMEKHSYVARTLLNVYIKCGQLLDARQLFDKLKKKSVVTWNMMIAGYAKSDHAESALELFKSMRQKGVQPNEITYLCILKACVSPSTLEWGKELHVYIRNVGFESDVRVASALLQMYAKCGCITEARQVFDRMEKRDLFTWNLMIGGLAQEGYGHEAYGLFLQMEREGFQPNAYTYASVLKGSASASALQWVTEIHDHARKAGLESDLRVGNALIHMYAGSGSIDDARSVFDRLEKRDVFTWTIMIGGLAQHGCGQEAYQFFCQMKREGFVPDVVTWNVIIGGLAQQGYGHEAYQLFCQMRREGLEADAYTYANILNSSASAGALQWVTEVHGHARKGSLESDLRVANALVHMYAKSGSIDDARAVFNRMEKRDVVAWTVMIGGLAQHGCWHEALECFREMNIDGVKPDRSTFTAVFSACCHTGRLDDGRRYFLAMTQNYGIEPDIVHYNCMVDLLGRAGLLEESKLLIEQMPFEPNAITWGTLLGACRTYGNVELGEIAANELFKLEPNLASTYVLLSNIYAAAGERDKQESVRSMMEERGVRKEPGRSWIEVDKTIHVFVVGDLCHPEAMAMYTMLKKLTEKLKAEGYVPDIRLVLKNISEADKELALCSHSEKVATAYGLMRIPWRETIRVFKNLRVCSDCHSATKLISKVTGREIIVRDANRFHHFKGGLCSCGDYW